MLPTTNINPSSTLNFGLPVGVESQPETGGGFDFLSYLLGLQSSNLPNDLTEQAASTNLTPSKPVGEVEEAVVSLFHKTKDEIPEWNPMFPTNPVQQSPVTPEKNQSTSNRVDADSLLHTLTTQKAQPKEVFQDPLAHLTSKNETHLEKDVHFEPQVAAEPLKGENVATDSRRELPHEKRPLEKVDLKGAAEITVKSLEPQKQLEKSEIDEGKKDEAVATSNIKRAPEMKENSQLQSSGLAKGVKNATEQLEGTHRKKEEALSISSDGDVDTLSFDRLITQSQTAVKEAPTKGERATVPELFHRVESMVQQGGGKMTVRLSPPDLGQVDIQVTTKGKRVEIEMRSTNDHAKTVLESKLSDLKTSLQSQDLILSKMEVHTNREGMKSLGDLSSSTWNGNPHQAYQHSQSQGFSGSNRNGQGSFGQRNDQSLSAIGQVSTTTGAMRAKQPGRVDVRI